MHASKTVLIVASILVAASFAASLNPYGGEGRHGATLVAKQEIPLLSVTGHTVHSEYSNFAEPTQGYSLSSTDFSFADEQSTRHMTISADDNAVYRRGYVSYDGQSWTPFTLSGKALGGDWLNGSVSADISFDAADMRLTQSRLSTDANFVVIYSCSRTEASWNCHSGWQIYGFTGTLQEEEPPPEGLIHWWKFDGDATDSAGSADGTRSGSAFVTGKVGQALTFDGIDDHVDVGSFSVGGSAVTITAWIRSDILTTAQCSSATPDCSQTRIISKSTGTAEQDAYFLMGPWYSGGPKLRFRLKTGGTTSTLVASSGNLQDNVWTHVAAVYDGSQMRLYKDGVLIGSMSKSGSIDTNDGVAVWIGDNPPSMGSRPWDGNIDDVRIYDHALTQQEVYDLYVEGGGSVTPDECQVSADCQEITCQTATCVQSSPKYCSYTPIIGCGGSCTPNPGEFLIADETYTYDESLCGFKYWYVSNIEDAPDNWKTPYDYEDGTIYQRYEVISQPTNDQGGYTPAKLQFGIWQYNSTGGCCRESMSSQVDVYGPGYVATHSQVPRTWWDASQPTYPAADAPVDFSSPGTFSRLGAPFWSDESSLVICPNWNGGTVTTGWAKRDEYYPMTVRTTVVAVPEGGEFSGWDFWVDGTCGADFAFSHNSITTNPPVLNQNAVQTAADYDGDGDLDFTLGSVYHTGKVYLYRNNGGSNWPMSEIGNVPVSSLGAWPYDVNEDGRVDLISTGVWYQNNGGGSFTTRTYDNNVNVNHIHDIVMADINGDGKKDVVIHSESFGTRWYEIPSDPTQYWTRRTISMNGTFSSPTIHGGFSPGGVNDLDGDGDNDVFLADRWFENTRAGNGGWIEHLLSLPELFQGSLPYGRSTRSVIVDIDNDGDNDVVFSESDKVDGKAGIIYNTNGNFGSYLPVLLPQTDAGRRGSLHSLRVEDFNMDGHLDILAVEQEDMKQSDIPSPRFFIWSNTGSGWVENVVIDNGLGGHDTIAADADQDGDMDILTKVWYPWSGNANGGKAHADYYENHVIDQPSSGTRLSPDINNGWTQHGGAYWVTKGDMIIGRQDNGNGGELISTQKFGDFEVVFDAWPDYSVDTGIYVRATDDGKGYQVTIDYQPGNPMGGIWLAGIGDTGQWDFEIKDEDEIQQSRWGDTPVYFPFNAWSYIWKENDWNQFRVRVTGNPPRIVTWINGWKVYDYTDDQTRLPSTGSIALQIHDGADDYDWEPGAVARFRNIKVYGI